MGCFKRRQRLCTCVEINSSIYRGYRRWWQAMINKTRSLILASSPASRSDGLPKKAKKHFSNFHFQSAKRASSRHRRLKPSMHQLHNTTHSFLSNRPNAPGESPFTALAATIIRRLLSLASRPANLQSPHLQYRLLARRHPRQDPAQEFIVAGQHVAAHSFAAAVEPMLSVAT